MFIPSMPLLVYSYSSLFLCSRSVVLDFHLFWSFIWIWSLVHGMVPKKIKNVFDFLSRCWDGEVLQSWLEDDEEVEQNWERSKDFDETFTVAFYNCGLQFDTSSKPFWPLVHRKWSFEVIKPEKHQNGQNCPKWLEMAENSWKWMEKDWNGWK